MKKNRTIFIGGLVESITTKDIDSHFREFGKIKNIVFKKNKVFDERRTFAYLVFQDKTSADNALAIDKHIIKGKRIDCQPAHGGKDKTKDVFLMMETKIHLKGLSAKVTSEDLQSYFIRFGEVRQAYVVLDAEQKKTKCFGFVQFYDPEITTLVLEKNHFLYEKRIKCEKFVPKEQKFLKNDSNPGGPNAGSNFLLQPSKPKPKTQSKSQFAGSQHETVADKLNRLKGFDISSLDYRPNLGGDENRTPADLEF
jgi:RNA recognition motif-containing protein